MLKVNEASFKGYTPKFRADETQTATPATKVTYSQDNFSHEEEGMSTTSKVLIGAGIIGAIAIAWALMRGKGTEEAKDAVKKAGEAVDEAVDKAKKKAGEVIDNTKKKAKEAVDSAKKKLSGAKEAANKKSADKAGTAAGSGKKGGAKTSETSKKAAASIKAERSVAPEIKADKQYKALNKGVNCSNEKVEFVIKDKKGNLLSLEKSYYSVDDKKPFTGTTKIVNKDGSIIFTKYKNGQITQTVGMFMSENKKVDKIITNFKKGVNPASKKVTNITESNYFGLGVKTVEERDGNKILKKIRFFDKRR